VPERGGGGEESNQVFICAKTSGTKKVMDECTLHNRELGEKKKNQGFIDSLYNPNVSDSPQ